MAHFWLGSRNLDQIYGKLLQRQKDGKLGQRNVAQDASVNPTEKESKGSIGKEFTKASSAYFCDFF